MTTKKIFGLGKGLGSLIPDSLGESVNAKRENVFYVEVAKIQPNPDQPRTDFDTEALAELSRSIRKYGVLQPLLVSKIEEDLPRGRVVKYQLIAGERRWRAAQMAGLPQVPVIIRDDLNPDNTPEKSTRLEVALIENLQREDLNVMEQAEAYVRLADEFGLKQNEIADKVGKGRATVANTMRLLNLPKYIKDAVRAGTVNGAQARALLSFADEAKQKEMYEAILQGGFNSKDLESAASSAKAAVGKRRVTHNEKFDQIAKRLTDHVGSPVVIKLAGSGGKTGQVIFRFTSPDELDGLVSKLIS